MKLTKFPVISPSGAEYRVVIREENVMETPEYDIDGIAVRLYVRRESGFLRDLFPWRRVWREAYMWGFAMRYDEPLRGVAEETIRRYEARPLADPAKQFRDWDGNMRREEAE